MMVRRLAPVFVLILIALSLAGPMLIVRWIRRSPPAQTIDSKYELFLQEANAGRPTEALAQGDALFQSLLEEKPDHPAVTLVRQRLEAARRISTLVAGSVPSSPAAILQGVTDPGGAGLLPPPAPDRADPGTLLPPAREAYWTRLKLFATVPAAEGLSAPQVTFLHRYDELHMQETSMEIGRRVVTAHPGSSEHLCYGVVLPLLYLHGRDDAWDLETPLLALFAPDMLDLLSRFALLQAERPGAALAIARYRAKTMDKELSPAQWAPDAVDLCTLNHRPDLAEQLVALVNAGLENPHVAAALRLKVAESYARCGDYGVAIQACERILAEWPDTRVYGRIVAAYLGYLAREEKTEQVITTTGSVLEDARCQPYLAQILYLRWWALRKADRLEEAAGIAKQLMEQYSGNPSVAPVLLERATDALARQEYDTCRELLTRLTRDFPGTESAKRAADILTRLTDSAVK